MQACDSKSLKRRIGFCKQLLGVHLADIVLGWANVGTKTRKLASVSHSGNSLPKLDVTNFKARILEEELSSMVFNIGSRRKGQSA